MISKILLEYVEAVNKNMKNLSGNSKKIPISGFFFLRKTHLK